jgi:hypothetical protein
VERPIRRMENQAQEGSPQGRVNGEGKTHRWQRNCPGLNQSFDRRRKWASRSPIKSCSGRRGTRGVRVCESREREGQDEQWDCSWKSTDQQERGEREPIVGREWHSHACSVSPNLGNGPRKGGRRFPNLKSAWRSASECLTLTVQHDRGLCRAITREANVSHGCNAFLVGKGNEGACVGR